MSIHISNESNCKLEKGMIVEAHDFDSKTWVIGMVSKIYPHKGSDQPIVELLRSDGRTIDIDAQYADIYWVPDAHTGHFFREIQRNLHELQERSRVLLRGLRLITEAVPSLKTPVLEPNANQICSSASTRGTETKPDIVSISVDDSLWDYMGWLSAFSLHDRPHMFLLGTCLMRRDEEDTWVFVANKYSKFHLVTVPTTTLLTNNALEEACARSLVKTSDLVATSDLLYANDLVERYRDDFEELFKERFMSLEFNTSLINFAPIRIIPTKLPESV